MQLKAILRDTKKNPKQYLKEGYVPAELYGKGIENIHVAVNQKEFTDVLKAAGESTIIELVLERENKKEEVHPVLIYETQRHYLSHQPIHIDFYQVQKGQKIKTHIPIEFVGESPAVKNLGGVLVKNMDEVEVEALPQDLPRSFIVDITKLDAIDSKICIKDLNLPATIKTSAAPETAIVLVVPPREEEVVSAPAESISEIKIETEEKKAERKEEKEGESQS
ncbi:MAG: 50S ribosomal protein L25 [Candidatus Paceibacterota bacterium]|jgi:large subunit ribosomal protein L25|nr:50S ribosomal protein L25 [Candidatus Paceibacterota bacterium]HQM34839.1 50S ribosomal protein L25 [Candidatus Paceibacterota bacterium]